MANYISKINIAGVVYDIYDKEARDLLAKTLVFVGVTSTAITDGASTPATYGGLSGITIPPGHTGTDTLDAGTVVIYNQKEFVWDGSKWAEFGDLSDLSLSTTTDTFLKTVSATPTNQTVNTSAGSSHSHTMGGTTKYLEVSADNSQKLVTAEVTEWTAASAKNVASAGTAVAVFNSIDSTATGGIKIITDVSGGGQAGEVTTPGVAAVLASTVATGLSTSNATATGRIAYTAGVTATNKMVTANVTPAAVGTALSAAYFAGGSPYLVATTSTNNTRFLSRGLQTVSSNSDGTNTNTLNLLSVVCNGVTDTDSADNPALDGDYQLLRNPGVQQVKYNNITPAVAGTAITYATGTLSTTGSGSAVATGGTTSYLYLNTTTQTTNTPTVVSFGTVVINGTPSYIHTSNIIPAVANGTIVGLNTSTTKTFATGSLATTGSGSGVATSVTFSVSTTSGTGKIAFVESINANTGAESAHTHTYSQTSAISITSTSASAITSVSLTPVS